ncbi:MAG: phosphotransferase family protein [bacterium]
MDSSRWLPAMRGIAAAHQLATDAIRAAAGGSNLIAFAGDEHVIKLFPPILRHQYESERLGLRELRRKLSVPTPEIVAEGALDAWPYIVMTRVAGTPLGAIWETCAEAERCLLLRAIGALIAEVQAVPPGEMESLQPRWDEFIARQATQCAERHAARALPRALVDDIERYLADTRDALPSHHLPVILTGEYTPENVLVARRDGRFCLSGLIDFGDAMVGFSEYDLLGPSVFSVGGNPQRLRALLDGFGYHDRALERGLAQRLMRLMLLHRYSDLNAQVRIDGWQDRVRDIDELERLLWPL